MLEKNKTMKRKKYIGLVILLIICASCEKWFTHKDEKFVECNANCYNLIISGEAINKVTNQGINNIPVTLKWGSSCVFFCPDNIIDRKASNNTGLFAFNNFIDSSYFSNGNRLFLTIPENKEFIIFPLYNYFEIYSIHDSTLKNLKFEFYPKTQLQIKIERVETDTFEYFGVEHRFCDRMSYVDCTIARSNVEIEKEQIFNVETASDIKTYIYWRKRYLTHDVDRIDSIICKKGVINTFKIQY